MIIALANQKGGVGKTTLTVHLAAYLARQGKRVLVIDADPQGNSTSWLLDGDVSRAAMLEILVMGAAAERAVRDVDAWGLELLPGNSRTGEALVFLAATNKPFTTVAEALRPLAHDRDYVLVDMPPSRAAGFAETLFAADYVIVPTQLERLSLEGVGYMAQTCMELRRNRHGGPTLLGVVPNMTRARTTEHQAQMGELVETFGGSVWTPVPLSVRVAEAASRGMTVFDLADAQPVAEAFRSVGERLVLNAKAV